MICPKCRKKYDNTWKVCLYDRSLLEPFDGDIAEIVEIKSPKVFKFTQTAMILVAIHTLIALFAGVHEIGFYPKSYGGWMFLYLCLIDPLMIPVMIFLDLFNFGPFTHMLFFMLIGGFQWFCIGQGLDGFFKRNQKQ